MFLTIPLVVVFFGVKAITIGLDRYRECSSSHSIQWRRSSMSDSWVSNLSFPCFSG